MCSDIFVDTLLINSRLKNRGRSSHPKEIIEYISLINDLPDSRSLPDINNKNLLTEIHFVQDNTEFKNDSHSCKLTFSDFVETENKGIQYCFIDLMDGKASALLLYS
ncbi:MAG: hypothetical protein KJP09_07325, partial [Bacteroidia bacterium]|nr:hypothetical protein [Bacteroidia bacterium]